MIQVTPAGAGRGPWRTLREGAETVTEQMHGAVRLGGSSLFEAATFAEWEQRMSNRFVRLQLSTSRPDDFHAVLHGHRYDDISLSRIEADAHQVDRLPDLIRAGEARYFKFSLLLAGAGLVVQDGREAVLGPGDMTLYDTSRPYSSVFEDGTESLVMVFPQEALSLSGENAARVTARVLSSDHGTGGLVGPFLARLAGSLDGPAGPGGIMLAHNALDLVNTLIHTELGDVTRRPDAHADALVEVQQFIERNLAAGDLSPAGIAAAHYMSTRRLHYLFEGAGTTVTSWIRARRVERCRRDLSDPALTALTITQISQRWGFADPAHFSRVFRATCGTSPSEYRRGC